MPILDPEAMKTFRSVGDISSIGIGLAATIIFCGAIGWWIDDTWQCKPWGTLIGCLIGIAGGMYNMIRIVIKANKDTK